MNIAGFGNIAPYLTHPLVLVGFVLMLAFGIHSQLMKSGLLRQVDKKDSGVIIRLFLRYGFWLALTLLLAGFGLSAWNSHMEKGKLTKAAAAARHLGALAFKGDTKAALAAYQKAVELDPNNADGWNQLAALFLRTGELEQAEEAFHKVLALGEAHQDKKEQAGALGNLGIVYQIRGELDKAEEMYRKALEISEALGRKEGMAPSYGNLGNVYQARGDLDQAEKMYRKSLEINEALGRKKGMATQHGNLGVVYHARGELDKAEDMYRKSLEISEALGLKEAAAIIYGNLGVVYHARGELDKAEDMHRRALEINEALGSKEGMAKDYGNLGFVYKTRGELDKAEELWKKSLSLYQEMQHPDAKKVQQWLDELAQQRASQPAPPAASPR